MTTPTFRAFLVALCCMVSALSAATDGWFTYTDNGTSITITRCPSNWVDGVINVPATIIGKPVTTIGSMAVDSETPRSITLPAGLTTIGDYAFCYTQSLRSITIPASVTSIGAGAFGAGQSLTSITVDELNATYSSLDGVLFDKSQTTLIAWPGGKPGNITIPAGVTAVGAGAFLGCYGLTSLTIPASVTSIGDSAFSSCYGLTSLTIPAGVTSIGYYAFSSCSKLASASFMSNAPTMGTSVFDNAASGFKVYYYNGRTGFTTPT